MVTRALFVVVFVFAFVAKDAVAQAPAVKLPIANKARLASKVFLERSALSSKSDIASRLNVRIEQLEEPVVLSSRQLYYKQASNVISLETTGGVNPRHDRMYIAVAENPYLSTVIRIYFEGAVHLSQRKAVECEIITTTASIKVAVDAAGGQSEATIPPRTTRVISAVLGPRQYYSLKFSQPVRMADSIYGWIPRCVVTPVR